MINKFIKPKTIALVGATNRQGSVGLALTRNLLKSQAKIIFINPKKKMLFKNKVFPSLLEVKDEIDLVVIAVKAEIVPKIAKECALKKVKAVIIISAGFSEINTRGKDLERETAQILTQASIPFLGPNCFGIIKPSNHLNTSFSSQNPKKGNLAFLSQSGALMNVLIEKSLLAQSGFSLMVSLGNLAGFGFEDWFEYLKNDKETKAIALYVENVKNGEAFIRKAQELSSLKPIIALKGGKTEQGKKASQSHTGALSSHSEIYSAAFRKAGIFEVETLEELFELGHNLGLLKQWQKKRQGKLAVLTNAGGLGVIASDYLDLFGLNNFFVKDLIGSAKAADFKLALENCLQDKVESLLVIVSNQMMTEPKKIARLIVQEQKIFPEKQIIACFLSVEEEHALLNFLQKNKIPTFSDLKNVCLFIKLLNGKIK